MKKTRIVTILICITLLMASIFVLSACGFFGSADKLTNESGFEVVGGGFEEGAVLDASVIDSENEDYSSTLSIIESQTYDKTQPVYVFEISVKKDNVKVQPNGKVKVSVPVSADLTGYDVLHIKGDGKIERLTVTYKNGVATFETDSFSKFVFVKKTTPIDSGDDTTVKYTVKPYADRIASTDYGTGGRILNTNDEYVEDKTLTLAEGTEYTVVSECANANYSFVGWYEATEREEATEDTFLSAEPTYTFTVTKNFNILALYAHKTDVVRFTLVADEYGFSYRNGEPTVTLVSLSDDAERPNHEDAYVLAELGNGTWKNCGSYSKSDNLLSVDLGGLDYSKVGTYTITYTYKYNSNIKQTLVVQVVDSVHSLNVTGDSNFYFYYNAGNYTNNLTEVLPTGRLVTLSAMPKTGYAFTGWYDENDNFVSNEIVYCFEMPNGDVNLHGKYESSSISLSVSVGYYSEGELVDDFGNAYVWGNATKYFKNGEKVSFTAREEGSYDFLGWYDVTGSKSELLTTNKTINLTITENKSIKAKFREKVKSIEIDSTTLADEGFVNGKVGFAIGDTIDYENFTVKAKGAAGSNMTLSASDYTIDDGALKLDVVGTYTITYTYKFNTSVKMQIQITVIDPDSAEFTFTEGYSYLSHKYDGKATFISLQDVKVNGIKLYNFKSTSKIWDKISYRWIDKATNEEVATDGVDVTIDGAIVKNFGGKNDKITIGNEFCGPTKAGSYRFELVYDGKTVLTQDSTISTQTYKKITSDNEFKTSESSSWINFELYYYTIIGKADNGKYYVMQTPSIGSGVEAEAREISVDQSGNAIVGGDDDFAFVYMRYFSNDKNSLEFLTGYYGSYIVRSSADTVDGGLFTSPNIYRTGYTCITDGKVYRNYGDKVNYGINVTFADDGAVTICSNGGSTDGRLRLVKDGDKYVFTSVSADTDARESFDIFFYRTIINTDTSNGSK